MVIHLLFSRHLLPVFSFILNRAHSKASLWALSILIPCFTLFTSFSNLLSFAFSISPASLPRAFAEEERTEKFLNFCTILKYQLSRPNLNISCSIITVNFFTMSNRKHFYSLLFFIDYIEDSVIANPNSISFSTNFFSAFYFYFYF